MKKTAPAAIVLAAGMITSCSAQAPLNHPVDYQSDNPQLAKSLEVPPDLTSPVIQNKYTLPSTNSAATTSITNTDMVYLPQQQAGERKVALNQLNNVQMEREGTQRWLLVKNRTPDQLWGALKSFWEANGFVIKSEEPAVGIMETDWAENRAKLPQDGIRKLLTKIGLGGIYSTSERDKFRIRLEETPKGTEIYFSHRGMEEVYTDNKKGWTAWQPRPTDPGLEAIFLSRFMIKLGVAEAQTKIEIAKTPIPSSKPTVPEKDGKLVLNDSFDRAWRRVGLALDRIGLVVTDRDRSQGLYYTRVAKSETDKKESSGFWSSLAFWKSSDNKAIAPLDNEQYRIEIKPNGPALTTVEIQDKKGQQLTDAFGKNALKRLQTELQ